MLHRAPRRASALGRALALPVVLTLVASLAGCAKAEAPPQAPARAPCFTIHGGSELRAKDAQKTLNELEENIRLSPEDEARRHPKSVDDLRAILRRDVT